MDTRTGEVMSLEEAERRMKLHPEESEFYKQVPAQPIRPKTGRNERCPCESGKKFKKCCLTVQL